MDLAKPREGMPSGLQHNKLNSIDVNVHTFLPILELIEKM